MMSVLFLLLPLALAEEPVDPDAEPAVEEPTGPDRSGAPPVRDPVPLELSDLTRHELSSGMEVWHVRVPRVRDVSVQLRFWKGSLDMPGVDHEAFELMSKLWGVASEKYDANTLSALEDLKDMVVYGSAWTHGASVVLNVPADELDAGLDLMADVALHPTFPKREGNLSKEEQYRWYTAEGPKSAGAVAGAAQRFAWIDKDHPYGRRPDLTAKMAVSVKDLPALHQQVIEGRPASMLVIGDLDFETIKPKLEQHFSGLEPGGGERSKLLTPDVPTATRVLAIDMPDSEQAAIRLRMAAPSILHPDNVALGATTWALGGHFLARFNKNLREDKGWTYGVRSGYSAGRTSGSFSVKVDVPMDKFAVAVVELEKELSTVVTEGVTDEELDARWRGTVKSYNDTRGTIDSAVDFYMSRLYHQDQVADRVARLEAIAAVDGATAQSVAQSWFGEDAVRLWVVAGPKAELEAGFEELGWTPEWISAENAILGAF